MPPARAFDHNLLKQLFIDHPDWSTYQFQRELTADNRRKDPSAADVKAVTVDATISRNRSAWEEEAGKALPKRLEFYDEIAPPPGTLASEHKMHTAMRYLRHVAREARGEQPDAETERLTRRQALAWAARMHNEKTIVDLTPEGEPFTRFARPDELNGHGELISLMAWKVPGWRQTSRV